MSDTAGLKYDSGKPRLDLVPPEAVMALGYVLTYGAEKYARTVGGAWSRSGISRRCCGTLWRTRPEKPGTQKAKCRTCGTC